MKKLITILTVTALLLASEGALSQTNTWDGSSSTTWGTAANWSLNHVPLSSEDVVIPSAPANQPLIYGTTGVCQNLTINSGASLNIDPSTTVNASLTVSGSATIQGGLILGASLGRTSKLIVGNITWASGSTYTGYLASNIEVSGDWEFSSGSAISMGLTSVTFTGAANAQLYSKSAASEFASVTINKGSGNTLYINNTSTATLNFGGTVTITSGLLIGQANITTIFYSNLINSGNFSFNSGTVRLEKSSGTQSIQTGVSDTFYNLTINTGGTVTFSGTAIVKKDLLIQTGVLDPLGNQIEVWGNWTNNVGTAGFTEGTGRVVFSGATGHQYCSNETFYIVDINKTTGALRVNGTTVTCNQYDWTDGALDVLNSGTFTANNLVDDGIFGDYYCNTGCTINLSNIGGNIDLRGNLYIYGGNFNVYGGNNPSWWPYLSNSSITMSGGVLNFADQGILIRTDPTYTFTDNITGGTIKTARDFTNGRSDFAPSAGTIELYGSFNSDLTMVAGNLFNLTINKAAANTVTLQTNATVNGALTAQGGTFKATNKILFTGGNIAINNGGTLWLENASTLRITGSKALTVASGGVLKAIGLSASKPLITNNAASGYHDFQVYGTISARYAIFEYNYGVNIWSTGIIDPVNPLDQCTFQYGVDRFLLISNSQEVTIRDANFPTAPLFNNVWKNNNAGRVTFRDATGAYAGAAWENDPNNRIDWIVTQPGLWTGAVSTNWHTPGNWDDLAVPSAATNVTIPAGLSNMPLISAGASCNNLTIAGTLTIGNAVVQAGGDMTIAGTLAMNNASGQLIVQGDVAWSSGSTAAITASSVIHVYGDWEFRPGSTANLAAGTVFFKGTTTKNIRSYSAGSSFFTLVSSKTGGANLVLSSSASQPLTVNGVLKTDPGSFFISNCPYDLVVKSSIISNGTIQCNSGAVKLAGTTQSITPNVSDYFNDLVFNQGGTATINTLYTNTLNVKGDLTINSGVFDAGSNIVKVGGTWDNNVGSAAFIEGTSRVVFDGGNYHQYSSSETFNILEVNKISGGSFRVNTGTVTCAQYDWTAGSVDVLNNGTFTALDLADNGLFGGYYVNDGCTIDLYQDVAQFVDLNGDIVFTGGGDINVFGGSSISVWAFSDDASVTMAAGTLDFKNQGIKIFSAVPHVLTTNITGGTIRTVDDFYSNRADFHPTGGTVELYGGGNTNLEVTAGSLWSLDIDKTNDNTVTLDANITINGFLTVQNATFAAGNKTITLAKDLNLFWDGILYLSPGAQLKMADGKILRVSNGGTLKTEGTPADQVNISHSAGYYNIIVDANGTVSARNTYFQYLTYINFQSGSFLDPMNAFYRCTFTNSTFTSNAVLVIGNSQDITIHEASFPTMASAHTVYKPNNTGHVTFKDATGAFAGPAYESDPNNRVDWSASTPGLWTGEFSSDWFTQQNWDDYTVPTATTDVIIPTGASRNPVIGSGTAYCGMITVQSGAKITVGAGELNVAGDMVIHGQIEQTSASADVIVAGGVIWESGSTANINANGYFHVSGNWEFRNGSNVHMANGTVCFNGNANSEIKSYESSSTFYNIYNEKSAGALYVSSLSTDTLKIAGAYSNRFTTSKFYCSSSLPLVLQGQLFNSGHLYCPNGTFIFKGTTNIINLNTGDYFNNIIFNSSGNISLADSLRVHGDLSITSGALVTNSNTILIRGNWSNTVGSAGFSEGYGTTVFEGTSGSDILTDESFFDLEINKSYANSDGVVVNDSITILNMLKIFDGTLQMNVGSRLRVVSTLFISEFAGLNASQQDVNIYCGDDWIDGNVSPTATAGFLAGYYSRVYFLNTASYQTIHTRCPFNDVIIQGSGNDVAPDAYDITCNSLIIQSGTFWLQGYKVTVNYNVEVYNGTLQMSNVNDSLVVLGDITWHPGSSDIITAGVILAGSDWKFQNGTNASLGTGNTVYFNLHNAGSIYCNDPDASFGNLVVDKSPTGTQSLNINGNSTDTMRVTGAMTVFPGNTFYLQNNQLIVDGNLDIQSTGTMTMATEGYLLNNHPTFVLNGNLVCNSEVLVHGTFEESVTGALYIFGGSFTSDAPLIGSGDWQYIRGLFNMGENSIFRITNNSIWIASTATSTSFRGDLVTGTSFHATSAGTFNPQGGTLKFTYARPGSGYLYCSNDNHIYNLEVEGNVSLGTDVIIKNAVVINSGYLSSNTYDIQIEGDWTNNLGPGGFSEGTNTVFFTGALDADITTNETFSNLVVAKTGTSASALAVTSADTVKVTNDLLIQDGCLNLQSHARLFVSGDLAIGSGAGLNAEAAFPNYIQVSGDWTNGNLTSIGDNVGFKPGSFCVVTFAGNADSYLSTLGAQEQFAHIFINKSGASFRSNDNIWARNLKIESGIWEDNVSGLHHQVTQGFDVLAAGSMQNIVAHNTVEFFGGPGSFSYLSSTGCMYNVIFNAQADSYFHLESDLNCLFGGSLTVQSGRLYANGHRVWVEGDLAVNSGGWLKMLNGSELVMTDGNTLDVNSGGRLELYGMTLRADPPAARYAFNINSGGNLDAGNSVIKNTGLNGIYLKPGSILLDDDTHPGFDGCTFMDGAAGGTLLRIDNDQTCAIRNAVFPSNTWGGASNVAKTVNTGHLYMVDYSGGFSGETYENDGFNLVDWIPVLTATATATPATICAGSSTQLHVSRTGGMAPFTYQWSPATGLSDPSLINPVATPAGTVTYFVTVTDNLGTTATSSIMVTVLPVLPVSVSITASANPSPPGNIVEFSALPVNEGSSPSYQWYVNGAPVGTDLPTYSYVPSNNQQVSCILTSNYACPSGNPATSNTISMIIVTVNTPVTGTASAGLHLCYDASNTVTVAGGGSSFIVQPGAFVNMIAGGKILYKDGTTVQPGGYMHGWITTTNAYCGSLPPAMVAAVVTGVKGPEEGQVSPVPPAGMFSIYPNPATSRFTLVRKGGMPEETYSLEIFSMRGERLKSGLVVNERMHEFDVSDLTAGLYFVVVRNGDHSESIKLIVQK